MSEPEVIVLGNQKSGTSAIAHLLADLTGLSKTIDLPRPIRADGHSLVRKELPLRAFVKKTPRPLQH